MRRRLTALLLALSACGGLVACDGLPGRPDPAERYQRPEAVEDFGVLYATQCSGCHGADGTHGPARPLGDPLYLALVGVERVRDVVAGGISNTAMPGFAKSAGGTLTDRQVEILTTGIFREWGDPARARGLSLPPYDEAAARRAGVEPASAERGAHAYAVFCAHCHGPDGRGGAKGGSVVDPSFLALVSSQMLRNSVTVGRPDLGMPDWRTLARQRPMSPQEISDVVAWLEARRLPRHAEPATAASESPPRGSGS